VGLRIREGACGDVNLSGVKCASILTWPKAIHEGNGKAVFVVDPAVKDKQIAALADIFTGKLGGNPWAILGPTYAVAGLVKAKITIEGKGRKSTFRAEGIGEGRGEAFKNPVTGDEHLADIHLPKGFIWKKGECGQGSFQAAAEGLSVSAEKSNWIYYEFNWSNR
jgi:hypothetical protein